MEESFLAVCGFLDCDVLMHLEFANSGREVGERCFSYVEGCSSAPRSSSLSLALLCVDDIARFLLMFYQCLMYLCCSSSRRPWWCLVAVVLAGLHCRTFRECKAASLAAACALALSDDTVPSVFLMLHVIAAVLAPMFPPKKKRQSNLNAFHAARRAASGAGPVRARTDR